MSINYKNLGNSLDLPSAYIPSPPTSVGSIAVFSSTDGALASSLATISGTTITAGSENLTSTTNQLVLGSTNTTTLSAPAPSSSITLTLPSTQNDTIVANNTLATLQNKTIDSQNNTVKVEGTNINTWLNQALLTTSGPVFTNVNLSNTTNQLVLGTTHTTTINSPAPSGNITLTLPNTTDTLMGRATTDTETNKSIELNSNTLTLGGTNLTSLLNQAVQTTSSPTFSTVNATSINSSGITLSSGNNISGAVNIVASAIVEAPNIITNNLSVYNAVSGNILLASPLQFNNVPTVDNTRTSILTTDASTGLIYTRNNIVDTSSSQTLSSKTLTSPIISTISNGGTLTLPTSTDTLMGRSTTDTETNKTIELNSNTVTLSGTNLTSLLNQAVKTTSSPTFSNLNVTSSVTGGYFTSTIDSATSTNVLRVTGNSSIPGLAVGSDTGSNGPFIARAYNNNDLFTGTTNGDLCIRNNSVGAIYISTGSSIPQMAFSTGAGNIICNSALQLATSGGLASPLSYYEENSSSYAFTGIWSSNQTAYLNITRIGNICILTLGTNAVNAVANTASTISTTVALPSKFRPVSNVIVSILVNDNGTYNPGFFQLQTTGNVLITKGNFGNFSGTGSCGFYAFTMSYRIN